MKRTLTDTELTLLEAALRLARDEYTRIAAHDIPDTHPHLAGQFKRQAQDAEALRQIFEDYPRVSVTAHEEDSYTREARTPGTQAWAETCGDNLGESPDY